jgi:hypothetical protein
MGCLFDVLKFLFCSDVSVGVVAILHNSSYNLQLGFFERWLMLAAIITSIM